MNTTSRPQPVLVVLAFLAGLDGLHVALDSADVIPSPYDVVTGAILAAANIGVAFYLRGVVTPFSNVIAYQPNSANPGFIVGGGAAAYTGEQISAHTSVGAVTAVPPNRP